MFNRISMHWYNTVKCIAFLRNIQINFRSRVPLQWSFHQFDKNAHDNGPTEKRLKNKWKDVNLARSFDKPLRFQSIDVLFGVLCLCIFGGKKRHLKLFAYCLILEWWFLVVVSSLVCAPCLINYGVGCVFECYFDDPYQAVQQM